MISLDCPVLYVMKQRLLINSVMYNVNVLNLHSESITERHCYVTWNIEYQTELFTTLHNTSSSIFYDLSTIFISTYRMCKKTQ